MLHTVSHACGLAPRNVGTTVLGRGRELLNGLSNDLEFSNDRILPHSLRYESVMSDRRVLVDVANGVTNVTKIDAIVLHRGLASASIRVRRSG